MASLKVPNTDAFTVQTLLANKEQKYLGYIFFLIPKLKGFEF